MFQQCLDDAELVADLGATEHGHERMPRRVEQSREHFDLSEQEPPAGRREPAGRADNRCVRPVRRTERFVDVGVAELAQSVGEDRVVLRLPRLEAQVLEEHDLTRSAACDQLRHAGADNGRREGNLHAEQLRQACRDGRQRVLGINRALRPSEVRARDNDGPLVSQPV